MQYALCNIQNIRKTEEWAYLVRSGYICNKLKVQLSFHCFDFRVLKSERSMILINLCVTLFIAYLVFLVGVNKTGSQVQY